MTSADPRQRNATDGLRDLLVRADHGSMTDAVTEALREAVISGVLPPHTWLREDEIAKQLNVSRTPVREALRRLSDQGLTQRAVNRGSVVAPMSTDELIAVYAVRELLEGMAARNAALRRDPTTLEALRSVHRAMIEGDPQDAAELARLNLEFHRVIRRASDNPYVDRFLLEVEHAVRRFPYLAYSTPEEVAQSRSEHEAIVDAIEAGDGAGAETAARTHLRRTRDLRLRLLLRE